MAFGINTNAFSAGGGEHKKLSIRAYSDPGFTKPAGEEFLTSITPVRYTSQFKTEQNKDQAQGTSAIAPKFSKTLPEELDIELMFDNTGVFVDSGLEERGVDANLDKLKKVILIYQGDEHKPNFVMITWGTLIFKGVLTDLSIEYKLFKPDATPIRAVAKLKLLGFKEEQLRVSEEKRKSPDLTHRRTVKAGDTLPLMTYDIYGDSKYYLEVAKANGIPNFRKLEVGQQIWFPPIQKQS
jgi:hypothetical protein